MVRPAGGIHYDIISLVKRYIISKREILRRKRDFAKMLGCMYVAGCLVLIDLIAANGAVAGIAMLAVALFFAVLIWVTNRVLTGQEWWVYVISGTKLERRSGAASRTIDLKDATSVRVKRTARGYIRTMYFSGSGWRMDVSGLADFDGFRDRVAGLATRARFVDRREAPIDFDSPWWYVFFGALLGAAFGFAIRSVVAADADALRIARYVIAAFVSVVGIFMIIWRPTRYEYGGKSWFDYMLGAVLLAGGIVAFLA